MYQNELNAISRSNRYRKRELYDEDLIDFSSNDYLGFAENRVLFERAVALVSMHKAHAPKASIVVNGYHPIHIEFEEFLARQNGFEAALVCGSGFLANFSLVEALPRKRDILLLDEEYHASGMVASKTVHCPVFLFRHNDAEHLEYLLKTLSFHRAIVCVEGIYSMSGDLLNRDIFEVVDKYNTVLVVDEAHSVGVVGENLKGIFELYGIEPKANYIKMGTLSKALGSYGAYILCSNHIAEFLNNRAKAIIYTTAPSLFDIALGYQGFLYMMKNSAKLADEIAKRRAIVENMLDIKMDGMICAYPLKEGEDALLVQQELINRGFLVGAIRPPTVKSPILRIIPRVSYGVKELEEVCELILKREHEFFM